MPKPAFSVKQTAKALTQADGIMSVAARMCGISKSAMTQRVQKSPELQQLRAELEEQITDEAVSGLVAKIREQEPWAICFWLKTKGKSRGFSETSGGKVTIDNNGNGPRITVEFVGNDPNPESVQLSLPASTQ